ncbi:hypothetical protein [Chenggangzhangella methanolivorans]|uniref:Uncharacterized protein n=1 Tax=Chenggangzhangella methanolivorans TaxID=1437009 RepID=A0A9E6RAU4_9HYPH|nr:hypothetical protein [Chenggangzhangella methanolivorans]QZO01361.1 hypothetical protein K6K41_07815 [Chenggangzhangella methanolivorans]
MDRKELNHCRVCGFNQHEPWGPDGTEPTYDICSCCGVEFGYEDCTVEGVKAYRAEWLAKGATWFQPKEKPTDWDLDEQMKSVPDRFKDTLVGS